MTSFPESQGTQPEFDSLFTLCYYLSHAQAMMGTSSWHHSVSASPGWWKPGGELLAKILPEPLTEHGWMANSVWLIAYRIWQMEGHKP